MNRLSRDEYEALVDILMESMSGYHCAKTNKNYSREDAINEFAGRLDIKSHELQYPFLRNIVHSAAGRIIELIESSKGTKQ